MIHSSTVASSSYFYIYIYMFSMAMTRLQQASKVYIVISSVYNLQLNLSNLLDVLGIGW